MIAAHIPPLSWQKGARFAGNALLTVAVLVVLGAAAFVALPRLLGWQGVVVLTGSMEPSIAAGSIAYVKNVGDPAGLDAGDVITFRRGSESSVTHRIVSRVQTPQGLAFETKGDANQAPDRQVVPPGRVTGRLVTSIPHIGRWSLWLQEEAHFRSVIWPLAGLLVAIEIWSISRTLDIRRLPSRAGSIPAPQPGAAFDGVPWYERNLLGAAPISRAPTYQGSNHE